jgi:hypothetical protein
MIKVAAPAMLCRVLDWAIQAHGGAGVTEDFGLAEAYAHARTMRIFDGPDEVHRNQIGRMELSGSRAEDCQLREDRHVARRWREDVQRLLRGQGRSAPLALGGA